jgi:hypothetical protein
MFSLWGQIQSSFLAGDGWIGVEIRVPLPLALPLPTQVKESGECGQAARGGLHASGSYEAIAPSWIYPPKSLLTYCT